MISCAVTDAPVSLRRRLQCETFPFAERLLKKGYEVLYLTEPIDEYAVSSLPEFEGKKFQNTAKEGLTLKEDKDTMEELQKTYEPLTKWLGEDVLSEEVSAARRTLRWHSVL